MPSGMMPLPVGVSVRDDEAVERAVLLGEPRAQQRGAQVAGGADLQRDVALPDDALEVARPASRSARH